MARRIKGMLMKISIKDITLEKEVYPRQSMDWNIMYNYANAMQVNKFPPITVAKTKSNKYVLIDGNHRLEALKFNKATEVEAEVFIGLSKQEIFEMAIEMNNSHGKQLTPYDKRNIALKLRKWKYSSGEISRLIQVPVDKLDKFIAQRLVNAITGETISEAIVKSGIRHLADDNSVQSEQMLSDVNKVVYSNSQVALLQELITLFRNNLIDYKNKQVRKLIKELKSLI